MPESLRSLHPHPPRAHLSNLAGSPSGARRRLLWRAWWLAMSTLPDWTNAAQGPQGTPVWSAWGDFARQFLQADGRILANKEGQTHSEAQSYALMFALIANDRARFERILRWTEDNLCAGDLTARLPAWLWGQLPDGNWGVIDANAASDADLWIAYALAEAGRLWDVRRYRALASVLAARIVQEETDDLPGLGLTLLPGPQGFVKEAGKRWRLNPSYLPPQVLHRLAQTTGDDAWERLGASARRILIESSPRGFAPDWVIYEAGRGFVPDHEGERQAEGAYNAIRVYLWVGMLDTGDPARASLLQAFTPMVRYVAQQGYPPEFADSVTGATRGTGGAGFSAALLPLLKVSGAQAALDVQQQRLKAMPSNQEAYYEQCLRLFGQGWMQGSYRFSADGRLHPAWEPRP